MKRITWWPQLWLGFTFNWGFFIGWSCITREYPNFYLLIFYVGCIFWTLSYDTAYALQDVKYDKKAGIRSSAVYLGNFAKPFMLISSTVAGLLWTISTILLNPGLFSLIGILITVLSIESNLRHMIIV